MRGVYYPDGMHTINPYKVVTTLADEFDSPSGASVSLREAIRAAPAPVRWLVLDADAITHADATGLDALLDVTKDLRRDEITLVVARLRTRMEEQLEEAGVLEVIGPGSIRITLIPVPAISMRSTSVSPSMANLVAT
mgnify:CR=1 FL=1